MGKIEEVKINNYKGIEDIQFPCGPINIIVGPNNTGKSSILQSIMMSISSLNNFKDILGTGLQSIFNDDMRGLKYFVHQGVHESTIQLKLSDNNSIKSTIAHLAKGYSKEVSDDFLNFINSISFDELLKSDHSFMESKGISVYEIFGLYRRREKLNGIIHDAKASEKLISKTRDELREILDLISKNTNVIVEDYKNNLMMSEKILLISELNNATIAINMIMDNYSEEIPVANKNRLSEYNVPLIVGLPNTNHYNIMELYKRLVKQKKIDDVLVILRTQIPYFEDIREVDGELLVLLQDKKESLPLSFMGAGFKSLLKLSFMLPFVKNGIVIFDEPEISLHPGYFDILAKEIVLSSKYSQFFIATHSLEFVKYIIKKAEKYNELESVNIIRLRRLSDGYIDREVLSGVEAKEEMESIETDLRGY